MDQPRILYDLDGRPYTPVNLEEQFARFAAMIKPELVVFGQEESKLTDHAERVAKEKEEQL